VGFEHTITAGERSHSYALDSAAIGTGDCEIDLEYYFCFHLLKIYGYVW